MAALRQYENGRWAAVVRRKGYRPQCKAFATHSDAKRWANQIESEIDRAVFVDRAPSERASIQGLIDRYVLEVLPAKKSAATLSRILRFVCRHFGGFTLATLQPKHIAAYRDSRLASGTAGATIVKELGTLSRVVDVAVREWGFFVPANPFKLISSPNVSRGRERRLTGDEESRLLDACRRSGSPMLGAIVRLALETGMRLGELLSLTWANIDTVKRTARLGDTKNGESRAVPLSTLAISTLISLPRNISSGRVFWTWSRPDGFENAWRRALGKAGIFDEADQLPSAAAMQVDMEILANVFNEFHITVETAEQAARDLLTRKLAEPEHKAAAKLVLEILADPAWYHSAGVTEDGGIAVHHKMPGLLLKRVANLGNTAFVSATLTLGGSFADFKRALGIGKESALSSTIEPVKHGELRFVVNDEHEVDTPEWMTAVVKAIDGAARPVLVVTPSHDLAQNIGAAVHGAVVRGDDETTAGAAVRVDKNGVLVAASAWAGLDTPIQWASVVVPKVPFPPPTILDGKTESTYLSARGVAIRRLRQVFGRGLRTPDAVCTIYLYDPRARKLSGIVPARFAPQWQERVYLEGTRGEVVLSKSERDPALRKAALRKYECKCASCGFMPRVSQQIEIHHLNPIAEGERKTTLADVRPLCANCHRLAHSTTPPMPLDALRSATEEHAAGRPNLQTDSH